MSAGTNSELQWIPPEVIAGFGGVAPSLLVPYFSFVIYPFQPSWAIGNNLIMPANPDRWAVAVSSFGGIITSASVREIFTADGGIWSLEKQGNYLFTFGDWGSVITNPIYYFGATSQVVNFTEIIYRPKRCP